VNGGSPPPQNILIHIHKEVQINHSWAAQNSRETKHQKEKNCAYVFTEVQASLWEQFNLTMRNSATSLFMENELHKWVNKQLR
jgi:hypothetical protein